MSIKRFVNAIDETNLVNKIAKEEKGDEKLSKLGKAVCLRHNNNQASMKQWEDMLEDGMKVAEFESEGSSYPWDGAANFKSTLITEAVRAFGDKAKTEIMKSDTLVTTKLIGPDSPEKNDSKDRIEDHMNWQINTEMKEWRAEHTRLMYLLPSHGAVFKKTFFDSTEGRNKSSIIKYPNFSLNQECDNLSTADFTEIKHYKANDVWERQQSGIWIKDESIIPGEDLENVDDDNFEFLEQYCNFDLDGDGYEEPLLVTVHKQSGKVVRIVPMWDLETIFVVYEKNTYNLKELLDAKEAEGTPTNNEEFNKERKAQIFEEVTSNSKLARIVPADMLTYYGFIESTDGSFLSLGYLQILGATVKGINKTTNSLMNAGELANLQSGWLSKEHRDRKGGPFKTKAGVFKQTNISASSLANSVMPLPFKEPSQVLMALTEGLKGDVKEMSAKLNFDDMLKPNVAASNVLGVLQEGTIPTSSLLTNVVAAMSQEFKILFSLNQKFTDPIVYRSITGVAEYENDYFNDIQISPTANAQFSNQMQRIQLAEAQMSRMDLVLQVGGNPAPIVKSYYEALGTTNMEEIFPEQMTPEQQKQRDQMMQVQQQQQEMEQLQTQLLQAQVQQAQQDVDRREKETDAKIIEMQAKIEEMQRESARKDKKLDVDLDKTRADTILAIEKAQTEDEKNRQQEKLKAVEILISMSKDDMDRAERNNTELLN